MKIEVEDCIKYLQAELEHVTEGIECCITVEDKMHMYGRRDTLLCLKWKLEDMIDDTKNMELFKEEK